MEDFRAFYSRYRTENDMGKAVRWTEDVYRTAFNERGAIVTKFRSIEINGETLTNVEVITNLRAVRHD